MELKANAARSLALGLGLMLMTALAPAQPAPAGGPAPADNPAPAGGPAPDLEPGLGLGGPGGHRFGGARPAEAGRWMGQWGVKALLSPAARQHLNLTDDQVTRLRDLDYNVEKQAIPVEAQIRQAELEIEHLMQADTPDRNQINAQVDTLARARAEREKLELGRHLDVRQILTPEQRTKVDDFLAKQRAQAQDRKAKNMDRRDQKQQHGKDGRRQEMHRKLEARRAAEMTSPSAPPAPAAPAPAAPVR